MTAAHQRPAPGALAVHVALAQDIQADPDAAKAALRLQACLVEAYRDAPFASVASSGAPSAGDAMIRSGSFAPIAAVRPRTFADRLRRRPVRATDQGLIRSRTGGAAMTFSASAKDGPAEQPGVILPGGVAMATGELSPSPSAAARLLMESRSGLGRGATSLPPHLTASRPLDGWPRLRPEPNTT
jgi:hypothetical protein